MNPNMMAKAEKYLELLSEIKDKVSEEATAVRILGEVAKDVRMEQIREERNNMAETATTKQLEYMKKLGIQFVPDVSKTEASRLISKELGRDSEE